LSTATVYFLRCMVVCPNSTCELNESCDGRNAAINCPQEVPKK
jgi:hypothetical protein